MVKRMTWHTRLQIEKLYNSGSSYRQIAAKISFSVSAVYREVQRGLYDHLDGATWKLVKYYSAQIADDDAAWQATSHGRPIKLGKYYDYAHRDDDNGANDDEILGVGFLLTANNIVNEDQQHNPFHQIPRNSLATHQPILEHFTSRHRPHLRIQPFPL